jgi:ankyrin repeat protein
MESTLMPIFKIILLTLFISCGAHKQFNESQSGISDIKEVRKDNSLEGQIVDAIKNEDLSRIEKLILGGQSVNAEINKSGRTLLTEACITEKWKSVKKLIELNADINLKDKQNISVHDCAKKSPILRRILDPKLEILLQNNILEAITKKNTVKLNKYLRDEIPNLNFALDLNNHSNQIEEVDQGQTLLTWLIIKRNKFIISTISQSQYLLDLNQKNAHGESPRGLAIRLKYIDIETVLINRGAYE